ncbi:23S rRNA pseudouridine(2605) synthase RluB [Marinicellulosiphila megalodicopiae]|uniref:23S rRNA pseudouridine(2605) synthase RluB n=1 Tax=Marinicellulosiphila megalodicopiae TaxID=2724896 RepID=UPI003BAFE46E
MSERIQKVLASLGVGSRRQMETYIEAGRVKVDGLVAKLGDKVEPSQELEVDGRKIKAPHLAFRRVIAYNKPEGEICTREDPEGRKTVFDKLPKIPGERWVAVGRLDINTSGLLLFTTDGELANKMMHPSTQIEREYAVRVLGDVNIDMINRMHEGVELEDGIAKFTDIQEFAGSGANTWYHVVIMEGRNREVRRLWESQGVKVSRLKRVRYGSVFMDSSLRAGTFIELDRKTIDGIAVSLDLPKKPWESIMRGFDEGAKRKMTNQRTRRRENNRGR